ncbi:acyl-ACP thioesterase domain-containing protein [uncultured Desulfobacter sp.]|uniref:acyl-[acyl-carrier-protein] thioesterase n=1 Tax=uncultured Desulfobacter sp. TaxID=240139 RepID=UPI002AA81FA8|nr:acyl-ACP thioesterase domain-containing protein [uncultured Desulfobacter sp.]
MKNNPDAFSQKFNLPYSALTTTGKIKMDWLLSVFQDAASAHCHALGISGFDMAPKNLKWVVTQYRIKIHKHIDWMTPLVVQTWRTAWKNLYEVRRFRLLAEQEQTVDSPPCPMVTASSIWILIKSTNNRPVRLSQHMPPSLTTSPAQKPAERIKPKAYLTHADYECTFPVHFLDLDLNEHVNNPVYVKWAVQSLPDTLNFEYTPVTCDVTYQKEALPGDTVQSRISINYENDRLVTDHFIVRHTSKENLAHLTITWKKTGPQSLFHTTNTD